MALGANTLTVTIDSAPKVLRRINQDNYVTRYYLHDGTQEFTAIVRHTRETKMGIKYDLHNIEFQQRIFATLTDAEVNRFQWLGLRNVASDDHTEFGLTAAGFLTMAGSNVSDLLGWVG